MFFYKNNIPRVKDNIAYCNWFNGVSMETRILTPVESISVDEGRTADVCGTAKIIRITAKNKVSASIHIYA